MRILPNFVDNFQVWITWIGFVDHDERRWRWWVDRWCVGSDDERWRWRWRLTVGRQRGDQRLPRWCGLLRLIVTRWSGGLSLLVVRVNKEATPIAGLAAREDGALQDQLEWCFATRTPKGNNVGQKTAGDVGKASEFVGRSLELAVGRLAEHSMSDRSWELNTKRTRAQTKESFPLSRSLSKKILFFFACSENSPFFLNP